MQRFSVALRLIAITIFFLGSVFSFAPPPLQAQNAAAQNAAAQNAAANLPVSLTEQIIRGRVQLEAGNTQAITVLQNAAQQSLAPLMNAAGPQILTTPPDEMPRSPAFGLILRQAAEAHYWWGVAADRFARRDIALTAFARAARFYAGDHSGTYSAARDALPNLRGALVEGLPRIAADDTLDTIAMLAHGGLWKPLKVSFLLNENTFVPRLAADKNAPRQVEFLITDGKLFISPSARDLKGSMAQVPPPFRIIKEDALPRVLKMASVVMGFVRETDGPNRGLWRQVVRVHYPHPSLTAKNRDDRPRAELLALQFLKLQTIVERATGLENPYAMGVQAGERPINTIWLSEVSALWPADEDDAAILAALGRVYMPKVNVPGSKPRENTELDVTPYSRPWLAAGQSDEVPGDIVFFKMPEPRSEAEWVRQLAHEYGHVVLPPFNGFTPPLEPYGNGLLGETLTMMWIAGSSNSFTQPASEISAARQARSAGANLNLASNAPAQTVAVASATGELGGRQGLPAGTAADAEFRREVLAHVSTNALASLEDWNQQGPNSALRRDTAEAGLHYLQGIGTYVERVYGAPLLGQMLGALPRIAEPRSNAETPVPTSVFLPVPSSVVPPPLQASAFLDNIGATLKNPFAAGETKLPLWLPGALVAPNSKLTVQTLISRAPMGLKANERAVCWLFVPPSASALQIEWKMAPNAKTIEVDGGWKSAVTPPQTPNATHALRVAFGGRSGWQRFAFTPSADITWSAAWFEKSALPLLPPPPR